MKKYVYVVSCDDLPIYKFICNERQNFIVDANDELKQIRNELISKSKTKVTCLGEYEIIDNE